MVRDAQPFDFAPVRDYWLTEAEESIRVADHLVEKQDYSYALFFGHLAIEKILKALHAVVHKNHAPPIHNLLRLARLGKLELNPDQENQLVTITSFNIEGRYPDFKKSFREKCTSEYTNDQMKQMKDLFSWIKSQITS